MDDLVDHWDAPPRRETRRRGRVALVRALRRGVPHVIGAALVASSAMLVAGQLFSAYRTVWPSDGSRQFRPLDFDTAGKVGQVIAQPFSSVPVLVVCLPLLVLAGLAYLPPRGRPPVASPLRLIALLISVVVMLVGLVLLVATAAWTIVTRGEVINGTQGGMYISVDPVVTLLTRGGDGLATAVLGAVAGWLLWTRSTDVTPADTAAGRETGIEVGDVGRAAPTPPAEAAEAAVLADPAYRLGSAMPGSPAPFVTRGASEPSSQHTDPTVFRRPSARPDRGAEPTPEDDDATSADPARPFRRPVR